jgi:hypothetical protein
MYENTLKDEIIISVRTIEMKNPISILVHSQFMFDD